MGTVEAIPPDDIGESIMNPFEVACDLYKYGFWFTYWSLRNNNCCTRLQALWLIWVAHSYRKHRDKMMDELYSRAE